MTQPRRAPRDDLKPEIEIAWARAVSRAFDDPAYYRYLKADPKKALSDLGADVSGVNVKSEIAVGGRLKPALDSLDEVIDELERKRSELTASLRSAYQVAGGAPCQPMHYHHHHLHSWALSRATTPPTCVQPTCVQPPGVQSPGYWGYGMSPGSPCVALSQVATTRARATTGVAPPQWIGGPPSGATCSE